MSLSHTFVDDESIITVPSVAVTLRLDGAVSDAFTGPATLSGDKWTVAVPSLARGLYSVKWDGGSVIDHTEIEVTGSLLFSIKKVRDSDVDLASPTRYPAADIRSYREVVEAEFERITGRSFVPRARRVSGFTDAQGGLYTGLRDIHGILAVTVGGVAVDLAASPWQWDGAGFVWPVTEGSSGLPVAVTVDYGFRHAPDDVSRAGVLRVRTLLMQENSAIPDRATGMNTADGGYIQFATAGRSGFETGIPDVDAVLNRYRFAMLDSLVGAV